MKFGKIITQGVYSNYVAIDSQLIKKSADIKRPLFLKESLPQRVIKWANEDWHPIKKIKQFISEDWKPIEFMKDDMWNHQMFKVTTALLSDGRIVVVLEPTGLIRDERRGKPKQ